MSLIAILLMFLSFDTFTNPVFKIEKEFNEIEYFDCNTTQKLEIGKDYWLGCTSAPDYMKSYISFKNDNKKIKLYFFLQSNGVIEKDKYLSTFKYPESGFSLEDLKFISEYLALPKPKLEKGIYYIEDTYPYKLMYTEIDKKKYIMICSITGGRAAEGIKVLKVLEVSIDKKNQEKYFD